MTPLTQETSLNLIADWQLLTYQLLGVVHGGCGLIEGSQELVHAVTEVGLPLHVALPPFLLGLDQGVVHVGQESDQGFDRIMLELRAENISLIPDSVDIFIHSISQEVQNVDFI